MTIAIPITNKTKHKSNNKGTDKNENKNDPTTNASTTKTTCTIAKKHRTITLYTYSTKATHNNTNSNWYEL